MAKSPKCAKCSKTVVKKDPGAQCGKCLKWYHASCEAISTEQLCALSETDSIDWKCRACSIANGGKKKRVSVILPEAEDEESDTETFKSEQDKAVLEMRHEVDKLRQTVSVIIRDELQKTLNYYSDKIDEYENRMKEFDMRFKIMENQCKDAANICKNLKLKNEALEQKISKFEQSQASNDVEICGMAVQENENVQKIAESLCQLINQKQEDIIRVVRKKKYSQPGSSQAERARVAAPITVSLREGKRESWCEAAKTKEMTAQDLGGENNTRVYLREALTPTTSYLLWKTKTCLKEKSLCKYVWCKNGQIMVRRQDGEKKVHYVHSEKDIDRIVKELQKT